MKTLNILAYSKVYTVYKLVPSHLPNNDVKGLILFLSGDCLPTKQRCQDPLAGRVYPNIYAHSSRFVVLL